MTQSHTLYRSPGLGPQQHFLLSTLMSSLILDPSISLLIPLVTHLLSRSSFFLKPLFCWAPFLVPSTHGIRLLVLTELGRGLYPSRAQAPSSDRTLSPGSHNPPYVTALKVGIEHKDI